MRPPHGFAADGQAALDERSHGPVDLAPALQQLRFGVGRTLAAVDPALRHVGKFEAQHAHTQCGQALGDVVHELAVHGSTRAMGEDQGGRLVAGDLCRGIPQPAMRLRQLRTLIGVSTRRVSVVHACLDPWT